MNGNRSTLAVRRFLAFVALLLVVCGCASPNVNPTQPKSGAGYVDFYVPSKSDLAWYVQRWDPARKRFTPVFSEFEPLAEPILRLELPPGPQQLRVTFLNLVTTEPATVELEIREGSVIPVRVSLAAAGTTSVRDRQTSLGGTAFGRYGRRTKIVADEETFYQISAVPEAAQPYRPKGRMPYAEPASN